jgi:LacI family transcriptional regulator
MVFDVLDPYCTPILRGIENSVYQESYLPILTDVQNERSRFERYLEMLLARRVEGLIVIANWLFTDIELIADLQKNRIPTVLIGRELEGDGVSSVTVDNYAGGAHALEHLYAFGHRDIAIIRGPKALSDSRPRWEGIRDFARTKRIHLDPRLVVQLPESQNPMSGFEFGQKLIADLLRKKRSFSAVMAFDDMSALGAMRALAEASIRVPERCSVVGFDDISTAAINTPALTTIRQPLEAMGSLSVHILLESLQLVQQGRTAAAVHRKLVPELIVRDSTGAPKLSSRP